MNILSCLLVMPFDKVFSLRNATAGFQALVNDVFWDMINRVCLWDSSSSQMKTPTSRMFVKFCSAFLNTSTLSRLFRWTPPRLVSYTHQLVELQKCFLQFINFYRCFIRNISSVADPINALTSPVRNYGVDISELLAVKHAFCMTEMSSGLLIVESLEPFPLHPVV